MKNYLKGDRILIFADWKDKLGAPANPTVTLNTIAPGETTPELRAATTAPSGGLPTGRSEFEMTLDGVEYKPGVWYWKYKATGLVERSLEGWFELEVSKF
ncbi:MAG TPA: hypothetical protein VGR85_09050 [Candidatus Limnocylindria bacterium]|jgi:hypothetical protein|nr:hypothetical protein [Candidatus Limnocylindria bacterium]